MRANRQMPSMGMLKFQATDSTFQLRRYPPSFEVSAFVKHYWIVSWDLTGMPSFAQDVIPNPCVNLVIEHGKSGIFAPSKQRFTYHLQGKGCVFGVKFKPGGFYPFVKTPISKLAGQPLELHNVFDVKSREAEQMILTEPDEAAMVAIMESILRPKLPEQDPQVEFIGQIIGRIQEDRKLTKVEAVCEQFAITKRTMQRLFDQYVGVNPKWVIQLYRLQNAAELIDQGQLQDGIELSAELGYYDQSHFIKNFKAVTGKTPDEYAGR